MVDVDKIALDAARNILGVDGGLPLVQRKARIQCIVADAMRSTAPQALAATPAVGERNDLLDLAAQIERAQVLYLNQFGTPNVAPLRDAFAQLLWDNKGTFAAALRAAAQPASPLRGRDSLLHTLQDIAAKRWDENADLDDICTRAESAIKLHSTSLRYGEPIREDNYMSNDLDKGDDA